MPELVDYIILFYVLVIAEGLHIGASLAAATADDDYLQWQHLPSSFSVGLLVWAHREQQTLLLSLP